MANFANVFAIFLLSTVSAAPQNSDAPLPAPPPPEDSITCPESNGQFKHPKYCDQYLNCWNGMGVVGKCDNGLLFNPTTSSCDYPERVNCDGTDDSRPQMVESVCPGGYGTFPNSQHCGQFIICHAGYVHVFNCPPTTVYNSTLGVCDHAPPEETCLEKHPTMETTPPQQPGEDLEGPPPSIGPPTKPTNEEMPTSKIPDINFSTALPQFPSGPDGSDWNNPVLFPVIPSWPKVTSYSVLNCAEGNRMAVVPAIPAYAVCVKSNDYQF